MVPAGVAVQVRASEMFGAKSRPRWTSGSGMPWSNAGLVREKFSGA